MIRPAWVKGILLLVVTFAGGVAVGVTYERRHVPDHHPPTATSPDAIHHLARELDLDSNQQHAISQILARHQSEIDATWHAMQPHMRTALDSTSKEIMAVLRPEQVAKYQKMTGRGFGPHH